ncbi:unnamed protein product [Polarella glacialis]|uniref:Oxidoreductase FAD/NAD(P)-binding domain-containing protein n=1 Tax=Polarella glacialis TaxID=89957 RepID=A0A813KM05_POLGL|nr:unnamed protein product [Polarella glacialis]
MVMASVMHRPVPPLEANHMAPTGAWLRCMEALAAVESMLHKSHAPEEDAWEKILVSTYNTEDVNGSCHKQRVDALLATHAKRVFPCLPAALAADPSLVLLLLDAPNILTTMALAKAFPELRTPALAARVCVPQADPTHYSLMVSECRMLLNVRFQRLDTWLTANANMGLQVPLFFADFELSVYGRSRVQFSPLHDIQRFLRYGYAGPTCLLGVTLSYRVLHRYPAGAPVLTEDDVVGFVEHEAACAGMESELLECVRYGISFHLFLLKKKNTTLETIATTTTPTKTATSKSKTPSAPASTSTTVAQQTCNLGRPRQSRLIHGHEHVTHRWRELGFVAAGGGIILALKLTRQILADKEDNTHIAILSVNRCEAEIPCYQELLDLQRHYPSRVRVAFSVTSASEGDGWTGFVGRGDVAMGRAALPASLCSDSPIGTDENKGEKKGVMVIVTGKMKEDKGCEGFVELWGGPLGEKVNPRSTSRMQRVQGSLGGTGLRALAAMFLCRRIAKVSPTQRSAQQMSNWGNAQLTQAQIWYAAVDAWAGWKLYGVMRSLFEESEQWAPPRRLLITDG